MDLATRILGLDIVDTLDLDTVGIIDIPSQDKVKILNLGFVDTLNLDKEGKPDQGLARNPNLVIPFSYMEEESIGQGKPIVHWVTNMEHLSKDMANRKDTSYCSL